MAETPKLTPLEADFLRAASYLSAEGDFDYFANWQDRKGLTRWDSATSDGPCLTDLGRAALAAYDAEQRRKVRVEAMRECLAIVNLEWSLTEQRRDAEDLRAFIAMGSIRDAIRALIATEESDG